MGNTFNFISPTEEPLTETRIQEESRPPITRNSHIEEALNVLDARNWRNVTQFLVPWGRQRVTIIHLTAYLGDLEMLKRANDLDLDLNAKDCLQRCALHYAAERGHVDVLKWLLDRLSNDRIPSVRNSRDQLQQPLLQSTNNENYYQSIDINRSKFDIRDEDGRTPLHAAVYGGNLECIRILIKEGLSLASETNSGVTVADAIFEHIPHPVAFLTEILDQHVTAIDNSGNKIALDFKVLVAPRTESWLDLEDETASDLGVILALIDAAPSMEEMEILQHPLLATFLHKKYLTATPLNILHLMIHVSFVSSLSWHAVCMKSNNLECVTRTGIAPLFASCGIISLDLLRIYSGTSVFGFPSTRNKFVTFMGIVISIMSLTFSIVLVDITMKYQNSFYKYPPEMLHAIAIMILLSWTNMLLVLGRFPILGEYGYMFFTILSNVGKILLTFASLIIGFAFSFMVLFYGSNQFSTPWKALAKTLVMMTGEYDYDSMFPSDEDNSTEHNSISNKDHITPLPLTSTIIFIIFVMVNSIGLMNLMVGLAVTDIQELLKEGRSRRLMTQADVAVHWIGPGLLISKVLKKPGRFTRMASHRLQLDLQTSSWIPGRGIPADLGKSLQHLAVKNSNRNKRPQPETPNPNKKEDSLAAIQASLERIEKRILNSQKERLAKDSKIKMQQRSM